MKNRHFKIKIFEYLMITLATISHCYLEDLPLFIQKYSYIIMGFAYIAYAISIIIPNENKKNDKPTLKYDNHNIIEYICGNIHSFIRTFFAVVFASIALLSLFVFDEGMPKYLDDLYMVSLGMYIANELIFYAYKYNYEKSREK